jgi:hypothetical protein
MSTVMTRQLIRLSKKAQRTGRYFCEFLPAPETGCVCNEISTQKPKESTITADNTVLREQ